MRFEAFFQALGQAMFEKRWTIAPPPMLEPSRVNLEGSALRTMQAIEQLSFSLQAGEITAAVLLSLPPRADIEDDEAPCDDEPVANRHYPLTVASWEEYWPASFTNWSSSERRVAVRHILVSDERPYRLRSKARGPLQSLRPDLSYGPNQTLEAPVVVLRADLALRTLLPLGLLPEAAQSERFRSFRNRLIDELVAAAWRAIAVHGGASRNVRPRAIMEYMHDYLEAQGVDADANGLSDKTLEAVARKIAYQCSERNTTGRVLLNSTPSKPPRSSG